MSSSRFYCCGLVAYRWTALGAFLASSASETASVECFVSATDLTPIDGGCEFFSSRRHTVHFTLRMPSFDGNLSSTVPCSRSIFTLQCYTECVLLIFHFTTRGPCALTPIGVRFTVWGFLLLLFGLALKHHRNGHKDAWLSPVTTLDLFNRGSKKAGKLPEPVTARRSRSQSKAAPLTHAPKRHVSEKRSHAPRPSQSRQPQMAYIPQQQRPHRNRSTDRYKPDYYRRDASPRR